MSFLFVSMMKKVITSTRNPLIKKILTLQEKPRERRKEEQIIIEGVREISQAANAGFTLATLLHCPDLFSEENVAQLISDTRISCDIIEISRDVFNRLAYRQDSGGLIGCARYIKKTLKSLDLSQNPLMLVLESVEKPGNLGAILRTADAAGLSAVIICDSQTDLYNPNTIRASLGTIFTNQLVVASSTETISWLQENKIVSFATALSGKTGYHEADFRQSAAIIMGSETAGLSDQWLKRANLLIKIPMLGKVDSLNVSASAAIVIFEALSQRGFNPNFQL